MRGQTRCVAAAGRRTFQASVRKSGAPKRTAAAFSPLSILFPAWRSFRREQPCIPFLLRQNFRRAFVLPLLQNVDEAYPEVIGKRRLAEEEEPRSKVSTPSETSLIPTKIETEG